MPRGVFTKLDEAQITKVAMYASHGLPQKFIADILCVDESTFYNWKNGAKRALAKDPDDRDELDDLYIRFIEALDAGRALGIDDDLEFLKKSDEVSSRTFRLERLYPEYFSKKQPFDVEAIRKEFGDDGAALAEELIRALRERKRVEYVGEDEQFTQATTPGDVEQRSEDQDTGD